MSPRWVFRAAIAVVTVLATAAPAPAASPPASVTVGEVEARFAAQGGGASNRMFAQIVAPAAIKGYQWGVMAYKATPRAKTLLSFHFARARAQDTQFQSSEFAWELPRGALRVASDLKPVSLRTGDGMGNNGSVDMRLTHTENYGRFPAEEGCSGRVSIRVGRFGGRLRFNARDEYFGRISMRGAQVVVYREHDYRCGAGSPPPSCPQGLSLEAADEEGVVVEASKTPEGKVGLLFVATRPLQTGHAVHTISAGLAVPEAFEASDDLTSASVDGDAASPWLSGDLSYVAPPGADAEDAECGPYRSSSGIATGDYTAHFDSIGAVTPASTGMTATLRREI